MRRKKPEPPQQTVQNDQATISTHFVKTRFGWWAHLYIGRGHRVGGLSAGTGWGRTKRSALRAATYDASGWFIQEVLGPKEENVEVKV